MNIEILCIFYKDMKNISVKFFNKVMMSVNHCHILLCFIIRIKIERAIISEIVSRK